jgi:hypothetical protein
MNTLKTTAASLISVVLIGSASVQAWPASVGPQTTAAAETALPASSSYLAPAALLDQLARRAPAAVTNPSNSCRPGHIYSEHDMVGDPDSCIMQGASVGGPFAPTVSVGGVR